MRVLVCGGRDYHDRDHIHNTLCILDARLGPITCVIHGAATGADEEGMIWAQMMLRYLVARSHTRRFGQSGAG